MKIMERKYISANGVVERTRYAVGDNARPRRGKRRGNTTFRKQEQNFNSALRRLEEEGTIVLQADSGRRKRVCLTDSGKALSRETVYRLIEIENSIYEMWTQEERDSYIGLTQRYLEAFEKGVEKLK